MNHIKAKELLKDLDAVINNRGYIIGQQWMQEWIQKANTDDVIFMPSIDNTPFISNSTIIGEETKQFCIVSSKVWLALSHAYTANQTISIDILPGPSNNEHRIMKINGTPDLLPITIYANIKNSNSLTIICSRHITFKKLLFYICEKANLNSCSQICTIKLANSSTIRIKSDTLVPLTDSGIESGSTVDLFDTHQSALPKEVDEPIIQCTVPIIDQAKVALYHAAYQKSLLVEDSKMPYIPLSQIEQLLNAKLQVH